MTSKANFDWDKYLKECLESTAYCSLATIGSKGVWSNPVYFAYDKNYNLYFISMPSSLHIQNIKENPNIAVSIYSTNQDTHGEIFGMQLDGKANILDDEEVVLAHHIYYGRVYPDGKHNKKPEENMGIKAEWKFVKIAPLNLYYFDTRFFGEQRQKVPRKIFHINE